MNAWSIRPATGDDLDWAVDALRRNHYLGSAPDRRSRPFAYVVGLEWDDRVGCLFFGRPESTRCYRGGLRYGSGEDVRQGRAQFDRWEMLSLSRLWLSPSVQAGGDLCHAELVPGFTDRHGRWRPALASAAIAAALARVGFDYLQAHPPCFPDQPYAIRAVLSYCDTRRHKGTVYRSAGWRLARRNADGVETWWTDTVAPLTACQDGRVRELSLEHPRSVRIRNRDRSLFDPCK